MLIPSNIQHKNPSGRVGFQYCGDRTNGEDCFSFEVSRTGGASPKRHVKLFLGGDSKFVASEQNEGMCPSYRNVICL